MTAESRMNQTKLCYVAPCGCGIEGFPNSPLAGYCKPLLGDSYSPSERRYDVGRLMADELSCVYG